MTTIANVDWPRAETDEHYAQDRLEFIGTRLLSDQTRKWLDSLSAEQVQFGERLYGQCYGWDATWTDAMDDYRRLRDCIIDIRHAQREYWSPQSPVRRGMSFYEQLSARGE